MKFKKLVALATTFFFLTNTLAWGQVPLAPSALTTAPASIPEISVPRDLGQIENIARNEHAPSVEKPFLIHIQDAHANPGAQKNIKALIEHLIQTHKISLILVEGASSRLDAKYLEYSRDPKANQYVLDRLAEIGELSGVDQFVYAHKGAVVYGIEENKLYHSTLESFRKTIAGLDEAKEFSNFLRAQLDRKASITCSKDLLVLIRLYLKRENPDSHFLATLDTLERLAKTHLGRDLTRPEEQRQFPNLLRVLKLRKEHGAIDEAKLAQESGRIGEMLLKVRADSDLVSFVKNFGEGAGNPRFLSERLYGALKDSGFRFADFPHFTRHLRQVIFQHEIRSREVFEEIHQLIELLFARLPKTEEEKNVVRLAKDIDVVSKLLTLELDRETYNLFCHSRGSGNPVSLAKTLDPRFRGDDNQKINALFQSACEFYEKATQRESIFLARIREILRETKKTKAILVTGGFHTSFLSEEFSKSASRYVVVSPKIQGDSGRSLYLDVMMGRSMRHVKGSAAPAPHLAQPWVEQGWYAGPRQAVVEAFLAQANANSLGSRKETFVFSETGARRSQSLGHDPEKIVSALDGFQTRNAGRTRRTQRGRVRALSLAAFALSTLLAFAVAGCAGLGEPSSYGEGYRRFLESPEGQRLQAEVEQSRREADQIRARWERRMQEGEDPRVQLAWSSYRRSPTLPGGVVGSFTHSLDYLIDSLTPKDSDLEKKMAWRFVHENRARIEPLLGRLLQAQTEEERTQIRDEIAQLMTQEDVNRLIEEEGLVEAFRFKPESARPAILWHIQHRLKGEATQVFERLMRREDPWEFFVWAIQFYGVERVTMEHFASRNRARIEPFVRRLAVTDSAEERSRIEGEFFDTVIEAMCEENEFDLSARSVWAEGVEPPVNWWSLFGRGGPYGGITRAVRAAFSRTHPFPANQEPYSIFEALIGDANIEGDESIQRAQTNFNAARQTLVRELERARVPHSGLEALSRALDSLFDPNQRSWLIHSRINELLASLNREIFVPYGYLLTLQYQGDFENPRMSSRISCNQGRSIYDFFLHAHFRTIPLTASWHLKIEYEDGQVFSVPIAETEGGFLEMEIPTLSGGRIGGILWDEETVGISLDSARTAREEFERIIQLDEAGLRTHVQRFRERTYSEETKRDYLARLHGEETEGYLIQLLRQLEEYPTDFIENGILIHEAAGHAAYRHFLGHEGAEARGIVDNETHAYLIALIYNEKPSWQLYGYWIPASEIPLSARGQTEGYIDVAMEARRKVLVGLLNGINQDEAFRSKKEEIEQALGQRNTGFHSLSEIIASLEDATPLAQENAATRAQAWVETLRILSGLSGRELRDSAEAAYRLLYPEFLLPTRFTPRDLRYFSEDLQNLQGQSLGSRIIAASFLAGITAFAAACSAAPSVQPIRRHEVRMAHENNPYILSPAGEGRAHWVIGPVVSGPGELPGILWSYLTEVDRTGFRFLNVKVRNASGGRVSFLLGLKHNGNWVWREKIPIPLPTDEGWRVIQFPIPEAIEGKAGVFIAGFGGPFEIDGFSLSNEPMVSGKSLGQAGTDRRIRELGETLATLGRQQNGIIQRDLRDGADTGGHPRIEELILGIQNRLGELSRFRQEIMEAEQSSTTSAGASLGENVDLSREAYSLCDSLKDRNILPHVRIAQAERLARLILKGLEKDGFTYDDWMTGEAGEIFHVLSDIGSEEGLDRWARECVLQAFDIILKDKPRSRRQIMKTLDKMMRVHGFEPIVYTLITKRLGLMFEDILKDIMTIDIGFEKFSTVVTELCWLIQVFARLAVSGSSSHYGDAVNRLDRNAYEPVFLALQKIDARLKEEVNRHNEKEKIYHHLERTLEEVRVIFTTAIVAHNIPSSPAYEAAWAAYAKAFSLGKESGERWVRIRSIKLMGEGSRLGNNLDKGGRSLGSERREGETRRQFLGQTPLRLWGLRVGLAGVAAAFCPGCNDEGGRHFALPIIDLSDPDHNVLALWQPSPGHQAGNGNATFDPARGIWTVTATSDSDWVGGYINGHPGTETEIDSVLFLNAEIRNTTGQPLHVELQLKLETTYVVVGHVFLPASNEWRKYQVILSPSNPNNSNDPIGNQPISNPPSGTRFDYFAVARVSFTNNPGDNTSSKGIELARLAFSGKGAAVVVDGSTPPVALASTSDFSSVAGFPFEAKVEALGAGDTVQEISPGVLELNYLPDPNGPNGGKRSVFQIVAKDSGNQRTPMTLIPLGTEMKSNFKLDSTEAVDVTVISQDPSGKDIRYLATVQVLGRNQEETVTLPLDIPSIWPDGLDLARVDRIEIRVPRANGGKITLKAQNIKAGSLGEAAPEGAPAAPEPAPESAKPAEPIAKAGEGEKSPSRFPMGRRLFLGLGIGSFCGAMLEAWFGLIQSFFSWLLEGEGEEPAPAGDAKGAHLSGEEYLKDFDASKMRFLHDTFYREGISLDGKWQVSSYSDGQNNHVEGPKTGHEELDFPGHWIEQGYFDVTGITARKRFQMGTQETGRRQILHFGGSHYETTVKLNGRRIQTTEGDWTHEGYFMPFEYDITDLLQYGEENEIEVAVVNVNEQGDADLTTENGGTGFPHWGANKRDVAGVLDFHDTHPGGADHQKFNTGGAWLPIRIFTVDARARISEAPMVNTTLIPKAGELTEADFDRRDAQINFSIPLENRTATTVSAQVVIKMAPENFQGDSRDQIEWTQDVEIQPGKQEIEIARILRQAKLWWPWHLGPPNLYRAAIEVRSGEEILTRREMRAGVRELTGEMRGKWYLNGRLIRALGDNVIPSLTPGSYTSADAIRDGKLIIDANLQIVRVHAHVPHPYFLEAADQMGFLVWQDFPQQWLSRWDPEYRWAALKQTRSFARMVAAGHPSIVVVNWHNENKYFDPPNAHGLPNLERGVWMHASEPAEEMDREGKRTIEEFYREKFSQGDLDPRVGMFILDETGADYHPYYGYYYGEGHLDYWFLPDPRSKRRFPLFQHFNPQWGWREEGHPDPGVGAIPTASYERLAGGGGLNEFGPDEFGFQGFSRSATLAAIRDVLREENPGLEGAALQAAIERSIREIPWGYLYAAGDLPPPDQRTPPQKLFVKVIDKLSEHNFHAWAFPIWIKPEKPIDQITFEDILREHQNYQAWGAQVAGEIYRRAGTGQVRFLFMSSQDKSGLFYSLNWAVLESDRTPKKAFTSVKNLYQPVLASSEILSQKLLPGERWLNGLWLNNDSYTRFNGASVVVELQNANGDVVKSERITDVNLTAFDISNLSDRLSGDWTVREPAGNYTLCLMVYDREGNKLSHNYYELRVLPNNLLTDLDEETKRRVRAILEPRLDILKQKFSETLHVEVAPSDDWTSLVSKLQAARRAHWASWKDEIQAHPEILLNFPEFNRHDSIRELMTSKLNLDQARQRRERNPGEITLTEAHYEWFLARTRETLRLTDQDLAILLGERGARIPVPLLYGTEITTDAWFQLLIGELERIPGADPVTQTIRQLYNTRAGHWFWREAETFKVLSSTLQGSARSLGNETKQIVLMLALLAAMAVGPIACSTVEPVSIRVSEVAFEDPMARQYDVVSFIDFQNGHGNLPVAMRNRENEIVYFVRGSVGGWKGNYIMPTDLHRHRFIRLRVRNLSGQPLKFYLELKYEGDNLLGDKLEISVPAGDQWREVQVELPPTVEGWCNYVALSDPNGDFEMGHEVVFSERSNASGRSLGEVRQGQSLGREIIGMLLLAGIAGLAACAPERTRVEESADAPVRSAPVTPPPQEASVRSPQAAEGPRVSTPIEPDDGDEELFRRLRERSLTPTEWEWATRSPENMKSYIRVRLAYAGYQVRGEEGEAWLDEMARQYGWRGGERHHQDFTSALNPPRLRELARRGLLEGISGEEMGGTDDDHNLVTVLAQRTQDDYHFRATTAFRSGALDIEIEDHGHADFRLDSDINIPEDVRYLLVRVERGSSSETNLRALRFVFLDRAHQDVFSRNVEGVDDLGFIPLRQERIVSQNEDEILFLIPVRPTSGSTHTVKIWNYNGINPLGTIQTAILEIRLLTPEQAARYRQARGESLGEKGKKRARLAKRISWAFVLAGLAALPAACSSGPDRSEERPGVRALGHSLGEGDIRRLFPGEEAYVARIADALKKWGLEKTALALLERLKQKRAIGNLENPDDFAKFKTVVGSMLDMWFYQRSRSHPERRHMLFLIAHSDYLTDLLIGELNEFMLYQHDYDSFEVKANGLPVDFTPQRTPIFERRRVVESTNRLKELLEDAWEAERNEYAEPRSLQSHLKIWGWMTPDQFSSGIDAILRHESGQSLAEMKSDFHLKGLFNPSDERHLFSEFRDFMRDEGNQAFLRALERDMHYGFINGTPLRVKDLHSYYDIFVGIVRSVKGVTQYQQTSRSQYTHTPDGRVIPYGAMIDVKKVSSAGDVIVCIRDSSYKFEVTPHGIKYHGEVRGSSLGVWNRLLSVLNYPTDTARRHVLKAIGLGGAVALVSGCPSFNGASGEEGQAAPPAPPGQGREAVPNRAPRAPPTPPAWRFAPNYSTQEVIDNPEVQDRFIREFLRWEGRFHQPGIGYNGTSGLTYDGHAIDFETGELIGGPRNWSASSKESLHVGLLALAVSGEDERVRTFISSDDPARAEEIALDILTRKITSYERFNREYPGYGGFLPWFVVSDEGLRPARNDDRVQWDWTNRVPALDNGQLVWSLYLAYHALEQSGHQELARRYRDYFNLMARNALTVFYDGEGRIRAEARIRDTHAAPTRANYSNNAADYFLDDPYEGDLFAYFMVLFGDWTAFGGPEETEKIWRLKRAKLEAVNYPTPQGPITVERGHWYSAHEQWEDLFLPYSDVEIYRRVFANGERARTQHSALNRIPGLFASVHGPVSGNQNPPYLPALGIQPIARQPVERQDVITPYAVMPVALAGVIGIAAAWLLKMLKGPKMQNPYGSTESTNVTGTAIAPVLTWDSKVTTVAAFLGGFREQIARYLRADGKYDRFREIVEREYRLAFPNLEGENIPFAAPTAEIPQGMPDFAFRQAEGEGEMADVLRGTTFEGGGALLSAHRFQSGQSLTLPAASGYIWNRIPRVDVGENHILNLTVRTEAQGVIFLEVKNTDDQLMTERKTAVVIPDTGGEEITFSIDLTRQGFVRDNQTASIFVFSDPEAEMTFSSVTFSARPAQGSTELAFDGRRFVEGGQARQGIEGDILGEINFQRGGDIEFEHGEALMLRDSGGWIWGYMPERDLSRNPVMEFWVRTDGESSVWLELKNESDEAIVGAPRFGVNKVQVSFPDTGGELQKITVDLSRHFRSGVSDRRARIIAFSDPSGDDLRIEGITFSAAGRSLGSGDFLQTLEARGVYLPAIHHNRIAAFLEERQASRQGDPRGLVPVAIDVTERIFSPADGSILGDLLDLILGVKPAGAAAAAPASDFIAPGITIDQFTRFVVAQVVPEVLPEAPVVVVVTESMLRARKENVRALIESLRPRDLVVALDDPATRGDIAGELRVVARGKNIVVKGISTRRPVAGELNPQLKATPYRFSLESLDDSIAVPRTKNELIRFKLDQKTLERHRVNSRTVAKLLRTFARVGDPLTLKLLFEATGLVKENSGEAWIVGEGFVAKLTALLEAQLEAAQSVTRSA